ncbi:GEVED domain-containing protein [Mariniflexile aquimaris]|uniref:GEVED domain-containing protein n=1 Tax=Mariniflexile aquimaris TaxID=881009 RepID=A0ABW3BSV7_9FLAO
MAFCINSFSQTVIYSESFSSSAGGWSTTSTGSGTGAWVRGSNSSHSSGATGNYFYSQKYSSEYNNHTYITATSPAIDLTGYISITLELKIWYNTESSYDGMKIEYSLNNGSSWNDLGSVSNSNWYNDSGVNAFNSNEDGWSGNSSGWLTRSINLSTEDIGFESATQAKFRVLFASDYSITDTGVAFDEIFIRGTESIYCSASSSTCDEFISKVQVGTINNTSSCSTGGYTDYTSQSTNMTIGTGYPITITNGRPYINDQCGIWVDWNQDGDFLDANETLTTSGGPLTYTSTITPPVSALVGPTRLRIRITYTGSVSSCGNTTYGEVEDYSINVIAAPSITTGTISPTSYCSGSSINVPFTITGTFTSGNVFTAQLSNASGNFTSPVSIGTLTGTTSGTISATIPTATATGNQYRIRVVSSNPVVTGSINGTNITINSIPTITGTTPASRCGTGSVTLGATASSGTINWYATSTGGTSLGTGTSFTTPSISSTTTYWVDATNASCTTTTRTAVIATINSIPTITGTTPAARCGTGSVTLGATASSGTINWYAASSGGASLATGTSFTTPSISSTTTYWVDATNGSCTTTTRTAVIATINSIPTITGTTTASRCGAGSVTLGATASSGTINWYAASSGGASLATGTSFTTPSISSTTTYWVDATNASCTTTTRTAVIATINSIPTITGTTPAARCGTGSVTLGATASSGTINWYAASSGGASLATGTSFTTPSISSTTTYWVDATNGSCTTTTRTAVIATINSIPTITGTTPASRCGNGTVTLGATASSGTINWYAASSSGASLATGTSFTTPSISSTTTYWVDATNGSCTTTTRTAVIATINSIPTITGTTPASRCGAGSVTLGATASSGTINWYATSTGGTSLGTGTSFTTPSISSTTTYWVDATNGSCTTATRTAVNATINKNYWTGDADTNWNNSANWCAGVPTNGIEMTLNVLIPSGLTNYPVISAGAAAGYVKSIVLENNTILTIIDNSLRVTENLKLDGKIDLEGEAQLLQDLGSILDPTSSGTLERDQQGTADTYTYNYWSSPVGLPNNTTNNNSYKISDIFQGLNFITTGYNGSASPLGIADYWIWKFSNKTSGDYSQWQHVRSTGTLLAGEGFTMKGPGTGSITTPQNYVLLGKPNNGDINLPISAGNEYLVGNPYPSALDANQFIQDNGNSGSGSTTGTLYFWEHWGGGSHILSEYQGGYATYTLAGGVPAASSGTSGTATKTPKRYIPVAQGFFVTASNSGTIKFNNGQRVFQIEDGENSLFIKQLNTKTNKNAISDTRTKLRLSFNSVNAIKRQLLVTVDSNSSMNYDWGYDAPYIENLKDDAYWMIDSKKYTIQGIDKISESTIIPLGIHTKNAGWNTFNIDAIEYDIDNLNIYLHDKTLNTYHNLKESSFKIYLPSGEYLNRFEITFNNNQSLLSTSEVINKNIELYFSNEKESIIINNPNYKEIKSVKINNILGQAITQFNINSTSNFLELKPKNIEIGTYIITLQTDKEVISKKVIIN